MFGRMIKVAALAGVGTMAYRWWQNKQAEDREYSSGDVRNSQRSGMTGDAGASSGMGSSAGTGASSGTGSSAGGFGSSTGGTTSPLGSSAERVPGQ